MEIDSHIGCAMSGLTADARTMIDHARVTSQNHSFTYDEPIGVESVTQAVCDLALRFGESMDNESAMMVSTTSVYSLYLNAYSYMISVYRVDRLGLHY
jgi:20S proteasome subunit alpha 5